MVKGKCAICGFSEADSLKMYSIVPEEIAGEAGLERVPKVKVCPKCWRELEKWFSAKIADTAYDSMAKQFLPKSPQDLAREYQVSYKWFVRNKREQLKKVQPTLL